MLKHSINLVAVICYRDGIGVEKINKRQLKAVEQGNANYVIGRYWEKKLHHHILKFRKIKDN